MPKSAPSDAVRATEVWFIRNGLPYFVASERAAARSALRPRRTMPLLVGVGLAAVGTAVALSWLADDVTFAPATLTFIGLLAGLFYGLTALRARPILSWAVTRTVGGLRQLVPMVTRALPLLLVFVTFLFINAEVWHVSSRLDGGSLWLTVLLFTAMGLTFFLVRLPEEIDRVDDELDDERVAAICADSPLGDDARRLAVERPGVLQAATEVSSYERANLTLALLIIQAAQVFLVAIALLVFFLVFGVIAMDHEVVSAWIGQDTQGAPGVPNLSVELLQVGIFLTAFSSLYFTVYAVTDETFRDQFFTGVMRELERAVAYRAVYQCVREERRTQDPTPTVTLAVPLAVPAAAHGSPDTVVSAPDAGEEPETRVEEDPQR